MDAEAEYLIQQALDEVLKGRTALVIAHRLSTIRNADKIIALEGGASARWATTASCCRGAGCTANCTGGRSSWRQPARARQGRNERPGLLDRVFDPIRFG